jgi:hypothetical protein
MTLVRTAADRSELLLTAHHLVFDGWSLPVLMRDLLWLYAGGYEVPAVRGYRHFLAWLGKQDRDRSTAYTTNDVAVYREMDHDTFPTPEGYVPHPIDDLACIQVHGTDTVGHNNIQAAPHR